MSIPSETRPPNAVTPAKKERSAGSRDLLVDAAIALVATRGLSALTYRALAAEAGVTHGAVQHHFASIEDVLAAAMQRTVRESLTELEDSTSPQSFVDNVRDVTTALPNAQAFLYQIALESRSRPALRPYVLDLYHSYWAATEASLRARGVEPDRALVRAIFAAGEGILYQRAILGDDDPDAIETAIEGLSRLIEAVFPVP